MTEVPFVERRFELGDDEVVARFYAPARAPGGEFQCRWTIGWPDREEGRSTCGEDGVQALMLAMRVHGGDKPGHRSAGMTPSAAE